MTRPRQSSRAWILTTEQVPLLCYLISLEGLGLFGFGVFLVVLFFFKTRSLAA